MNQSAGSAGQWDFQESVLSDVGGLLVQMNMTYLDDDDGLLTGQRSGGSSRLFFSEQ